MSIRTNPSFAGKYVGGSEDIIREILLRLPAKSLIRFKLVSKQWLSRISDPQFGQSHVRRNPNNKPSGMFIDVNHSGKIGFFWLNDGTETNREVPSLEFLANAFPDDKKFYILQSSNGLLLCRGSTVPYRVCQKINLCVCNPTTKKYRLLPQPSQLSDHLLIVHGICLVFDPSVSLHYKVICLNESFRSKTFQVKIYSSENQSWRFFLFHALDYKVNNMFCNPGVFWNGAIHWTQGGLSRNRHFLQFNLNSESLVRREMPSWPLMTNDSIGIGFQVGVQSARFAYFSGPRMDKFYILEMSKDYSNWIVKYEIYVRHLITANPEFVHTDCYVRQNYYDFFVLALVEGMRKEDSAVILSLRDKVVSYNFKKGAVKTVLSHGPVRDSEQVNTNVFEFIEILSSV